MQSYACSLFTDPAIPRTNLKYSESFGSQLKGDVH